MLNNKQEDIKITIKKTAKNTLKHLKKSHPTLTLSELTEALSKGLGFQNYHAASQYDDKKTISAKSLTNWNDLNPVNELALYYPEKIANVILIDYMNNKKYPFNEEELSKIIKKDKNKKDPEKLFLEGMRNHDSVRWLFPVDQKSVSFVVEDMLNQLEREDIQRLIELKNISGFSILEEIEKTKDETYLDRLYIVVSKLLNLNNGFNKKYMNYIKNHEENSYVSHNFNDHETYLFMKRLKDALYQIKTKNTEPDLDVFYYILLFFRLLLNDNMFSASLNEKIIYFLLKKEEFIKKHDVRYFNVHSIVDNEMFFLEKEKLNLMEARLKTFHPNVKVLFSYSRYYDSKKGIMYYNEDKKMMEIQINFNK